MKCLSYLFGLFFLCGLWAQDTYRLKVEPFDFQNEDQGFQEYYLDMYRQMVIEGRTLYLRNLNEPHIIKIDTITKKGERIGKQGEGPGEFRAGGAFMGVNGNRLWVVDMGKIDRASLFIDGKYKRAVSLEPVGPHLYVDGDAVGVSDRELVMPVSPATGYLAKAYGFDGSIKSIRGIPFDRSAGELVFRLPYINQTTWHLGGDDHWYAAFPFAPLVFKYNRAFERVDIINLEHPAIQERIRHILEFEPKHRGDGCIPLVTDVKWFRKWLFVMCTSHLLQIDGETGNIVSIIRFFVNDPSDEKPGLKVFPMFAFREDGTLFLGHPVCHRISGHDMYQINNPPFL